MRSSWASMSCTTSGSAFSLMVMPAVVCGTYTMACPSFTPACVTGTRLWPMSRSALPKQLIRFINGKSLLELSVERLHGLVGESNQFICAGESHREVIVRSLPGFSGERYIGEPMGRDTLNAV